MTEMDKIYDPKAIEPTVYQMWLDRHAFHARPGGDGPAYSIVIPPPNVTSILHAGHALNATLQDVIARQKRMAGFNTLWMPGTDHAGIATQTVVEKRILAEEGKRRTDFARDEFIARVQTWKDQYESRILGQLKAVGCSCDWERTRFTMDAVCAKAVRTAFFRLFSDGLIYRGKRLVNWDPATQTVLADDEVEHETIQGNFWYMRYPLVEPVVCGSEKLEHITVATTRPETMLGDTAVAINPRDPRASALVGKMVRLPIVGRLIPIIADEFVVLPDPESQDAKARFATGFLKVTPAHDPNDWAIGLRHGLPVINVLAPDGSISDRHGWADATTPEAQELIGLDRFEAREAIVEWFRTEGLLEDVKPYAHEVGHSYRSHVPIEPYLSDQWFVAVKKEIRQATGNRQQATGTTAEAAAACLAGTDVPVNSLAGLALAPVVEGKVRFVPERYAQTYRSWLENLRDWPISRQLWWGHRIPVWSLDLELPAGLDRSQPTDRGPDAATCAALDKAAGGKWADMLKGKGQYMLTTDAHPEKAGWIRAYICPGPDSEAIERAIETFGFVRDPDVLDTWFSSALWPISTMGWPEETDLLKTFYPTDVLVTAREIITLWVSRMVMFGMYFRGDVPFRDVFINPMIQDGEGRKMSKSLGNGVDPLDIIESHGADAMRFTLCAMATETQDIRMPVEEMTLPDGRKANSSPKFDQGRNFCNKLWNAARFAMSNIQGAPAWSQASPARNISDAWILSRLNATIRDVTSAISAYRFHDATDALYRYMWNDFCDWYLEISKVRINAGDATPRAILAHALDVLLRLLHPVMPFITEAIWEQLNAVAPNRGPTDSPAERMLATAAWPRAESVWIAPALEDRFAVLQAVVGGIREARNRHNVPASKKVRVTVACGGDDARLIQDSSDIIRFLAGAEEVAIDLAARPTAADATVMAGGMQAFVRDVVDRDAELGKLTKRQETLAKGIAAAEGKLNNPKFRDKAPADLVARETERLAAMKDELSAVVQSLELLK